jgi:hypothetical protein
MQIPLTDDKSSRNLNGGVWRVASHSGVLALWKVMSTSSSRRFPVTVTHLPVTRCEVCRRTVAYQPGNLSKVLTEHYRRAHPEVLRTATR